MVDLSGTEIESLEWKGYVRRALESIDKKLVSIDVKMDSLDTKMDKTDECVDGLKVKLAAIGGTVSLVVTIVVLLVKELLAK